MNTHYDTDTWNLPEDHLLNYLVVVNVDLTDMESAASLFGPEDTSTDPFASLGGQDTSTEVPQDDYNAHRAGFTTDVDVNGSSFLNQDVSQDTFPNSDQAVNRMQESTYPHGTVSNQVPVYDGMPGQQTYQPTFANGHGYQAETQSMSIQLQS